MTFIVSLGGSLLEAIIACMFFGIFAGVLAGLFGIGGGIVIVPFLIWLFESLKFPVDDIVIMAIATSLATIIITSVATSHAHHRLGTVNWHTVCRLSPGILLGVIAGTTIADWLPAATLRIVFACYLIYVGIQLALQFQPPLAWAKPSSIVLGIAGVVIGLVSAVVGIGGGTLTVPFLMNCHYPMRNAVAISCACGLPISLVGTCSYAWLGWGKTGLPSGSIGYVFVPAFLGIVSTSTLFAKYGASLANKLPTNQIKRYFSILVFLVAIKLLWQY